MHGGRSVNERLERLNEAFAPLLGTYHVACECDDAHCEETVEIPPSVFDRIRAGSEAVVHPRHVRGAPIVASHDGWAIVQR